MPKTAGTSLRVTLTRRAGRRTVLWDYGAARETSPEIRALGEGGDGHATLRAAAPAPRDMVLIGHFPARRYWDCFNADSFVTFVRDPVARVVSDWNHQVVMQGLTQDLLTYAAQPNRRDVMSRMLGPHWRRFGFIGLTERYAECLPLLSAHLGIALDAERLNGGLYPDDMPRGLVDPQTAARIAAWNPMDMALHAAVKACWDRHGRWLPEPVPAPPRLRAREVRPGLWRGVCADAECRRSWVVSVRQEGREVARVWADGHAAWLRALKGIRTGIGTFRLDAGRLGLSGPLEFAPAGLPPATARPGGRRVR